MNRSRLAALNLIGLAAVTLSAVPPLWAAERSRLAVLTDIGGDPDDQQSIVRLICYTCFREPRRAGTSERVRFAVCT
jgi:hypothetical protein